MEEEAEEEEEEGQSERRVAGGREKKQPQKEEQKEEEDKRKQLGEKKRGERDAALPSLCPSTAASSQHALLSTNPVSQSIRNSSIVHLGGQQQVGTPFQPANG